MSTTAALIEGHYFMSLAGMGERWARCQCGVEFEWNDRDKAHARHLLDVVRTEERERIGRLIEAARAGGSAVGDATFNDGMDRAARIAREGA